jgi:mRNA-degrading endonuclease RelE of RelBE toxin-antitoxin system
MSSDIEYRLVPTRRFEKELKKHSRENQKRVLIALQEVQKDPYNRKKAVKLRGDVIGDYRWRVGQLRVFYEVVGDEIRLLAIKKRDHAYDK